MLVGVDHHGFARRHALEEGLHEVGVLVPDRRDCGFRHSRIGHGEDGVGVDASGNKKSALSSRQKLCVIASE